jgi:hypothetical protein
VIIGFIKEVVSWFVSLTEVSVAIAAMLLIGLIVGMTGFWMLSHFLSKLGGPAAELDPYEDEPEETAGAKVVVSICPDEDSPSSKPGT